MHVQSKPIMLVSRCALGAAVILAALAAATAHAATYTWDPSKNHTGSDAGANPGTGTVDWATGTSDIAWTATSGTDTAFFGAGGTGSYIVGLQNSTFNVGGLAFNSGNYTVNVNFGAGALGLNLPSVPVTVNASATAYLQGVLTGTGGLNMMGPGLLSLGSSSGNGSNNFTGNVIISGGTVADVIYNFGSATAGQSGLGNPTTAGRTVTINGGVLQFGAQNNNAAGATSATAIPAFAIIINSGGNVIAASTKYNILGPVALGGGTLTTLAGDSGDSTQSFYFGGGSVSVTAPSTIVAGAIASFNGISLATATSFNVTSNSGGTDLSVGVGLTNGSSKEGGGVASLFKTGPGLMLLSTTDSYTGGTTINQGTLEFSIPKGMPSTGAVSVASSAVLAVAVGGSGYSLTGSGSGTLPGLIGGTGGQGAAVTWNAGALLGIDTANASAIYAGNITSGPSGLVKLGANALTLTGSNTYAGSTTISAGTLQQGAAGAVPATSVVLNGGATAGVLDLGGYDLGINTLNGSGGAVLGQVVNSTGANTLNVGQNNASSTFAGILADGGGVLALRKSGTGAFLLTGPNTHSGATTINAGALRLGPGGSLGNTAVSVNGGTFGLSYNTSGNTVAGGASLALASGAVLDLTDGFTNALNFTSGGTLAGATLKFELGSGTANSDQLDFTGVASMSGTNYINVAALSSSPALGNYTLINAPGGGLNTNFSLSNPILVVSGTTFSLSLNSSTPTAEVLTVANFVSSGGTWASINSLGGAWDTPSNWQGNTVPSSGTLTFPGSGGVATVPVSLTQLEPADGLLLGDGVNSTAYQFSGGTINLGANTVNSTIGVLSGSHTISSAMQLNGNLAVSASVGGSLYALGSISEAVPGSNRTLSLAGAGTLVLGASNSYSGGTTVNSGTLQQAAAGAVPTGNLTLNGGATAGVLDLGGYDLGVNTLSGSGGAVLGQIINSSGSNTLTVGLDNSSSTFAGTLANGSGGVLGLRKAGTGLLLLTGPNTHSGATTINSGALRLGPGGSLGNTAVSVASSATLGQSNNSSGNSVTGGASLSLNSGATLDMIDGYTNTLNFTSGGTLAGATLDFELGSSLNTSDRLAFTSGVLTPSNTNTINVAAALGVSSLISGDYTLITAASGLNSGFSLSSTTLAVNGHSYSLGLGDSSGTAEVLTITSVVNGGTWASINSSGGTWGTGSNWTSGDVPTYGTLTFPGSAGVSTVPVTLTASRPADALVLGDGVNSTGYQFSGGTINMGVTAGTSTITARSGSHTISSTMLLNGNLSVTASAGAALQVLGSINQTVPSGLRLAGAGTLALGAANTYTGATTVNGGTLTLAHAQAVQNSTVTVNASGGALGFAAGITQPTLGGLTGNGTINLATAASEPVALTVGNNAQSTTYSGTLSGAGGLTKVGAGVLTLASPVNSSYSGPTIIAGGKLTLGSFNVPSSTIGANFYSATGTDNVTGLAGVVPMSGWNNCSTFNSSLSLKYNNGSSSGGSMTWTGGGGQAFSGVPSSQDAVLMDCFTQNFNGNVNITLSGIPYANYSIYAYMSGSQAISTSCGLTGGPTYYYTTNVNSGSNSFVGYLAITNTDSSTHPNGNYIVFSGLTGASQTLTAFSSNNKNGFAAIEIVPPATSGVSTLPSTTALQIGGGAFDLNGATQQVASLSDYAGGGGSIINSNTSATAILTLSPTGTSTSYGGSILSGGSNGAIALVLNGNGTQLLAGSNTYSGGTTILSGVLQAANTSALGAGAATVNGGTLDTTAAGLAGIGGLSVGSSGSLVR